jgi:hypothetical protein
MSKIVQSSGGITFSGKEAVTVYQAVVLKTAISMYAKTGMRVNRAYTPKAMLATASSITGNKYKRGEYSKAVSDLEKSIEKMKENIPVERE